MIISILTGSFYRRFIDQEPFTLLTLLGLLLFIAGLSTVISQVNMQHCLNPNIFTYLFDLLILSSLPRSLTVDMNPLTRFVCDLVKGMFSLLL